MDIHIGKLIENRLVEQGLSKADFARALGKQPQNIPDVFKKKSIDTDLLSKISNVLDYDFFQHFRNEQDKLQPINKQASFVVSKAKIVFEVELSSSDIEALGLQERIINQLK